MKKTLFKTILTAILLLSLCFGVVACGENSFKVKDGFTPKNTLTATKQGGFALETDEFYYVINGVGDSTADNSFGAPIKGSLIAVKKDFSGSAIVVPKLFVASDYDAGVYIFDGYVYYATPSTSVELSGETKNSYLTFAKTKLDGTDYTEFTTVSGLSSDYRFVKSGDSVFVVYYDSENEQLVSLNTKTNAKIVIAKTDDENLAESLESYDFFSDGKIAYTTTVYKGNAIEGTQRSSENFNKLYIYQVGDGKVEGIECYGKKILDGYTSSLKNVKYAIKAITNDVLLYTKTDTYNTTGTNYIYNENGNDIVVAKQFDATHILEGNIVYTLDTTNKKIITNNLSEGTQTVFADGADVTTLLFKKDDFIYFVNGENKLARIAKGEMLVEYISEDTVSSSWFKPVFIGDGIMYLDNSAQGASNVKFVKLADKKPDYQDDDNTKDIISYHYEGQIFVAGDLRLEEDIVAGYSAEIDAISSTLKNGRITEETETRLNSLKESYNKLSESAKETVKDKYAELDKYHDAITLAEICKNLEGIELYTTDSSEVKTKYETKYNEALEKFTALETKGNDYFNSVCKLMKGNTYYWFKYAKDNIFNK